MRTASQWMGRTFSTSSRSSSVEWLVGQRLPRWPALSPHQVPCVYACSTATLRLNFEVQHLLGLKEAMIGCFVAVSFSWSVVEVFSRSQVAVSAKISWSVLLASFLFPSNSGNAGEGFSRAGQVVRQRTAVLIEPFSSQLATDAARKKKGRRPEAAATKQSCGA
jgi:hypothetical protein